MKQPDPFKHAQATALAIRATAILRASDESVTPPKTLTDIPFIWVNANKRHDIRDLWRAHQQYGDGEQENHWLYDIDQVLPLESVFYLSCEVAVPTQHAVTFIVAFPLLERAAVLDVIAQASAIGIMTEPFPIWKEHQEDGAPLVLTPEMKPVMPDRDKRGLVIGHVIRARSDHTTASRGMFVLRYRTTNETRTWLDTGGYVLREDVAQLYNDGIHGLYKRDEDITRPNFGLPNKKRRFFSFLDRLHMPGRGKRGPGRGQRPTWVSPTWPGHKPTFKEAVFEQLTVLFCVYFCQVHFCFW